jgi:hypothetical protein
MYTIQEHLVYIGNDLSIVLVIVRDLSPKCNRETLMIGLLVLNFIYKYPNSLHRATA